MFKKSLMLAAFLALTTSGNLFAQADALVEMLQRKGLLTTREANEVKEQTFRDMREQMPGTKINVGSWLDELRIYGDMRLRYEQFWNRRQQVGTNIAGLTDEQDRTRFRYRLRPGMTAKAGDWEAGFRLASGETSGNGDPVSTNTSFDGFASKKSINVDLAYLKYTPNFIKYGELTLTGGKYENTFWETDMVYDADLTPEGFSEQYKYKVSDGYAIFANLGQWVLSENNTEGVGSPSTRGMDRYMIGWQLGHEWKILPKKVELKQAVGFYDYINMRGQSVVTDTGITVLRNTTTLRNGTPVIEDEFQVLAFNNELRLGFWEKYPIRLQGEYINNLGQTFAGNDAYLNEGYKVGAILGEAKKRGQWQIGYWYESLEANATFSGFSDSDFGNGGTNNKGHIIKAQYMVTDWVTLGVAYWNVTAVTDVLQNGLTAGTLANQNQYNTERFQFDVVMKF